MRIDKAIMGIIIFIIIYIMLLFNPSKDNIGTLIMMTIILLIVLTPIIIIVRNNRKREKEFLKEFEYIKQQNNEKYIENEYTFEGRPVEKLLSNKELDFYNMLKPIADKYNMLIFSKVRLADIIETPNKTELKKIWSRHVDFVITDMDTSPIAYVELDDVTHTYEDTLVRDEKKNTIFESVGLYLIRVKTTEMESRLPFIETIIMNKKRA